MRIDQGRGGPLALLAASAPRQLRSGRGPLVLGLVTATMTITSTAACTHTKKVKPSVVEVGAVVLRTNGRHTRVEVEVVRTPQDRQQGLMYRKHLDANAGMLFIFDREEVQSFWMVNTYIPLDMIFIDRGLQVVGVIHNAEPMTATSRKVDRPALYTLEVNGGFARAHGIGVATRVELELPR